MLRLFLSIFIEIALLAAPRLTHMLKVTFYLPNTDSEPRRHQFICRLTHKIYQLGHRVHLQTPDAASTETLDKLLWCFADTAFLPHSTRTDDPRTRITIHHEAWPAAGYGTSIPHPEVLITLAESIPAQVEGFTRIADVVGTGDEARARGRERYRHYQQHGYIMEHHEFE